jgi:flagellar motility protein MotE (MotC chaperone)
MELSDMKRNILQKAIILSLTFFFIYSGTSSAENKNLQQTREYSSVEERRLQQVIIEEKANLQKERSEIAMRKNELKTLEEGVDKKLTEIEKKIAELKKLQSAIKALLAEKSAEEKKRIKDLAKIYEKMNPAKASLALSGLDQKLAADLLANMKIKAAAKILDQTSKQKTTQLSNAFSTLQLE